MLCIRAWAAFLFYGRCARKETVPGYLTPAAGTIYVEQGQRVAAGQPLLTVATSRYGE